MHKGYTLMMGEFANEGCADTCHGEARRRQADEPGHHHGQRDPEVKTLRGDVAAANAGAPAQRP
jgi:hypothetical protein